MKMRYFVYAVVISALIIVALFALEASEIPEYETPATFGSWGEEIIINYEDGSSEPLKTLQEGLLSTLTYDDKAISGFTYRLKAKAVSDDYTNAEVEFDNVQLSIKVTQNTSLALERILTWQSIVYNVPVDDTYHQLGGDQNISLKPLFDDGGYIAGTYTISFMPSGDVRYRGYPTGDWTNAILPMGKSVDVVYEKGSITLDLQADF